jgi:hypothetical protein
MTHHEHMALLRLIESLDGATSKHLHGLFFQGIRPARAWHPLEKRALAVDTIGTTLESARRRLSSMVRHGEIEPFEDSRPPGRFVSFFLTPLAYSMFGSELRRSSPVTPSAARARRGWQRAELWAAVRATGHTVEPGQGHNGDFLPFDVIEAKDKAAYILVDNPAWACEDLARSIPVSQTAKRHPVLVRPSFDGSLWNHQAQTWLTRGPRFHELCHAVERRQDCALWEPKQFAGVGLLEDSRRTRRQGFSPYTSVNTDPTAAPQGSAP